MGAWHDGVMAVMVTVDVPWALWSGGRLWLLLV